MLLLYIMQDELIYIFKYKFKKKIKNNNNKDVLI